jgi:integration host factor subunit beta
VTKSELVTSVSESTPTLTRKHAELVVNTIFDSMRDALVDGDRIEIRGFGSFQVRERASRTGRNPKTGVAVEIQRKRVPFFKVGKELRERVNND